MPVRCDDVAPRLAAAAGGVAVLSASDRRHVESCLRCQAEVVHYRQLLRALHTLRTELLEPAPGLLAEVLGAIEEVGERRAIRSVLNGRRAAYVGGIAAATAAAAGGAIVIAGRARRRLPLAG
jgi:hypothetical protein